MAKPNPIIKYDFSRGEVSPRLDGRVDLQDFARGLKTCENFIPFIQGPLVTRPGTLDVGPIRNETARARLIPFKYGTSAAYMLEFSNTAFKVYKNNAGSYEIVGGGTYNISLASYSTLFDPSTQITTGSLGFAFSRDGTKMYIGDAGTDDIFQYTLSTPWNVSTAVYASKVLDVSGQSGTVAGIAFDPTGTRMYIADPDDGLFQYTLSTPWDISTATYASKAFDPSAQLTTPYTLFFKPDGTKVYITGPKVANATVYEYNLTTAWDISTAVYSTNSLDVSSEGDDPAGLWLSEDGKVLFVADVVHKIYQYTLSTAWDISTATYSSLSYDTVAKDADIYAIQVSSAGDSIYVYGAVNNEIFQFALPNNQTTPYATADLQDIQYCQSNDVLYLAHPSYPPQKILRSAETDWIISPVNFSPPPTQETKEAPNTTLTLSAYTGTGITVTAGAATFISATDVGKVITAGVGRAIITAYTNTTTVTADVIDDFSYLTFASGAWHIKGTPYVSVTPSAVGPVGATITLTTTTDAFRNGTDSLPTDIGKYIYINSGIAKITAFATAKSISAKVIKVLSGTTASYVWTMEKPIWNSTDSYPSTVVFHQDRLDWGGSAGYPQTIALSKTGDYENHARGTSDNDALLITLNAREVNSIEWLISRQALIVGTTEAEWLITSSTGLITPSDVFAQLQTAYGSKSLRPAVIDGSVLFFQRLGRKLRELTYDFNVSGYTAPEISLISEHITDGGIEELAYQQSPLSILWMVRSDGQLIGLTFDKNAGAIAWHRHVLGGAFSGGDAVVESVACIPHPSDDYDELWMIVKRTINGTTSRRIEVLTKLVDSISAAATDYWQLDSGKSTAITSSTQITGLDAWEGETLTVVNKSTGGYLGTFTVSGGIITLTTTYSATMLTGYPFNSDMQLLPLAIQAGGLGQAQRMRFPRVSVLFYKSQAGQIGSDASNLTGIAMTETAGAYSQPTDTNLATPPAMVSDWRQQSVEGTFEFGGQLYIRQHRPFPMTILAIVPEVDFKSGSSG